MSISKSIFSLLLILGLSAPSSAQFELNEANIQANGVEFSMDRFVDRVLNYFDDEDNPVAGYQLVFSKDGQPYHQEARGWAIHPNDNGGVGVPMTTTTRFDVASVSKFLCTLTLANALEFHGIGWSESVAPYLPPSWVSQLAPEHLDPSSECYLTFEKLIRHETCLGWPGDESGPIGGTAIEVLDALLPAQLNPAEHGDYQNGNFILARILVSEILIGNFLDETAPIYDEYSVRFYYEAADLYIFEPLNLDIPASISEIGSFYSGNTPHRYAFPFNTSATCNGELGSEANPSAPYNFTGSTGWLVSSLELAAIMAYFIHDDSGTIISTVQRDYILANGLGLSPNEWNQGNTIYGQYYEKGGLLRTTCGSATNIQRSFRTSTAAYPNGVELSVTTNSNIDFMESLVDEWEDAWQVPCAAFIHTSTEETVQNHFTMIDHPSLNGDPDMFIFASPIYRPGSANISPLGVWYDGSQWGVFNQNFFPMPEGAQFGVYGLPSDYPLAFTHEAATGNTFLNITTIDHPLCNDRPDAELIVTQNWASAPGVFNPHNIGVIYTGSRWRIVNLDYDPIPAGAKFNILVNEHHIDRVEATSPVGNTSLLINEFLDVEADDVVITTNLLETGTPFNDSQTGVWLSDSDWLVYNTDIDPIAQGSLFNYFRIKDGACCDENITYPVVYVDQNFNTYSSSEIARDTVQCFSEFDVTEVYAVTECESRLTSMSDPVVIDPGGENTRVRVEFDPEFPGLFFEDLDIYVYLTDNEAPEFQGLQEEIMYECGEGEPSIVTAIDNCSDPVELTYEDETVGSDCDFTITRTWTATDFAGNSNVTQQTIQSYTDCTVFDTAPVDLNKSFQAVNGVSDRVQLKWYKQSPQIKYTDEDAAACDIRFWPRRTLDPISGAVTGTISNPDTVMLVDKKKFLADGVRPREIFKWPLKFRADGIDNTNRVEPNIRYQWQVRCACMHGAGQESPWSEVRTFNTPDFDPTTGFITPSSADETKQLQEVSQISIYPNPSNGEYLYLENEGNMEGVVEVVDLQGKLLLTEELSGKAPNYKLQFPKTLAPGVYLLRLNQKLNNQIIRFQVR